MHYSLCGSIWQNLEGINFTNNISIIWTNFCLRVCSRIIILSSFLSACNSMYNNCHSATKNNEFEKRETHKNNYEARIKKSVTRGLKVYYVVSWVFQYYTIECLDVPSSNTANATIGCHAKKCTDKRRFL